MTRLQLALYALLHVDLHVPRPHFAWTVVGLTLAAAAALCAALLSG